MNSAARLALTLATLFSLRLAAAAPADRTGCSFPAPAPRAKAEWTVMVYVNGDNNLEQAALVDVAEMAAVGSTDDVNVVVQLDLKKRPGTWRFRVTKDMALPPPAPSAALPEVNMGDGKSLGCFVRWSLAAFPAAKTALVIWDHGQGWRDPSTPLTPKEEHRFSPARSSREAPYKSASQDDTDHDELLNRETADALRAVLKTPARRLDVLAFDACLMAMIETAYAFRDVASVLVASEELVPASGFDYKDWLGTLGAAPAAHDARGLATLLVSSFERQYVSVAARFGTKEEQTLSAFDLGKAASTSAAFSRVATRLLALLPGVAPAVAKARCALPTMAPRDGRFLHVDLDGFLDRLDAEASDAELHAALGDARAALRGAIVARYPAVDRGGVPTRGLAVYFPATKADYLADDFADGGYRRGNLTGTVEFVEDFSWSDLLPAYWAAPPPPCVSGPADGAGGPGSPTKAPRRARQALVIGNSAYITQAPLSARGDAAAIAEALASLGFDVMLRMDRKEAELKGDAEAFLASLAAGDTALFYFAGHGLALAEGGEDDRNYLVPIDAAIATAADVTRSGLSLASLYTDPRFRMASRRLVVLDACRATLWQRPEAGVRTGLAEPRQAPPETLVAYAAEPGGRAADGDLADFDGVVRSPYTLALLRYLRRPGIPVEEVFKRTRELVWEMTQRTQSPWETTSLTSRLELREGAKVTMTLSDCDDVVYLRDERMGRDALTCGLGQTTSGVLSLEPGDSPFGVQVFNQKTCRGGLCAIALRGEGWKYRLEVGFPGSSAPTVFSGGEDDVAKDGPRHGNTFPVARFVLHVDEGDPARADGSAPLVTLR